MRLLHTSDWHIGRTFHGVDLLADQEQVLTGLADIVTDCRVDAVVVAGDVYDRAIPSADAMQVAGRVIGAIRSAGAQVIAISGNHDSAPRLGVFAEVLVHGGLHLRTSAREVAQPVVLGGSGAPVAVYTIPYLEPEVVRRVWGLEGRPSHQDVVEAAMVRIRADLASRPAGTRSVVASHAFVVGGRASGSERSIAVGGVESVTADIFDGIDYVALGHLHGRQQVAEHVRYSGSPLPYSFSEASQSKGVWLVDIPAEGPVDCAWRDLPTVRPLATVRGTLDEIVSSHRDKVDHYLAVELTDAVRPVEPMRRIREHFPFAVTLAWMPDSVQWQRPVNPVQAGTVPDEQVIGTFLQECRGTGADEAESAIIADVVAGLRARQMTT